MLVLPPGARPLLPERLEEEAADDGPDRLEPPRDCVDSASFFLRSDDFLSDDEDDLEGRGAEEDGNFFLGFFEVLSFEVKVAAGIVVAGVVAEADRLVLDEESKEVGAEEPPRFFLSFSLLSAAAASRFERR